jgi:uncharacterized protein with GYD domain
MAKYLVAANYTADGIKGLLKEGGTGRRQAVDKLAASLGGSVESFYFAFGATDVYVVVDVPSQEAAAALALSVGASGAVGITTTVLLSAEQIDEARAMSPQYRAPGQ